MEKVFQHNPLYIEPKNEWWTGRIDGQSSDHLRWHQWLKPLSLSQDIDLTQPGVGLLGFACDEGVKRNQGRLGAAQGPRHIRMALNNLPVLPSMYPLYDFGDIQCINGRLETAQALLTQAITSVLSSGCFPIILGGGHEMARPHYESLRKFTEDSTKSIGIINFDAHFDLRKPDGQGLSSGTGFWEIAQVNLENKQPFNYLALGIQKTSNTINLFNTAKQLETQFILAPDFHYANQFFLQEVIHNFIDRNDFLYLSIDMDVFGTAFAPGVSAVSYNGISPDLPFLTCLRQILLSKKVLSVGIAETNPLYDIDNRTAKLVASILMETLETLIDL